MKTIKMESGIEIKIDENVANDMELLDDMVASDEGDPMAMSRICSKLLSKAEKKKLYDSLRDSETKRVPVQSVVSAIVEIITKMGKTEEDGKNS